MRATLRWALADLRTHRGEALFSVLATAGIITALLLATALFSYASNPWQRVFTQSVGAHVWIHTTTDADSGDLDRLARMDGVESAAGPYRTARLDAMSRAGRAALELRGVDAEPPRTARPLITDGSWLTERDQDGVVLESSVASALWVAPGDSLTVRDAGQPRTLTVIGVADTAEHRYQAGVRPGLGWVLPGTLERATGRLGPAVDNQSTDRSSEPEQPRPVERPDKRPGQVHQNPRAHQSGQVIGLRLDDPGDTGFAVQRAVTLLGADGVTQVSHWQQARSDVQGEDRVLGTLLAGFGVGALLAAALAIAAAISSRIRGQLRDISVLKAIGFTPWQVVRIFLVQHLAFALLGALVGVALLNLMGARLPGRLGEVVGIWEGLPGHTAATLWVPAVAVLFIGATTSLAAWRAGRVPPVPVAQAAVPPAGGMSRAARTALGWRLPPALVLGWRAAFHPRLRSLAAVARLSLPLLLITVALSAWSTLERVESRPAELGLASTLTARTTGELDERQAARILNADPDVVAVRPGTEVAALAPGQTGTLALRGLGRDQDPFPFGVLEGRAPSGPDEAVAGQGLLDQLDLEVGDWVRLTVEGSPQILHVVGRTIEPERGGRVITTSLDTLREQDPELRPDSYHLELREGAVPAEVGERLTKHSDGRLEVRETASPVEGLKAFRGVILGVIAVLALIGLTELLTTVAAGIKERQRDLLAWKAIGLTPRQITAVLVTAVGLSALCAAVAGTTLGTLAGRWFIDAQGNASGIGTGLAVAPPAWALLSVVGMAVAGAVAVSVLPAIRTANRRLADTLSAVF